VLDSSGGVVANVAVTVTSKERVQLMGPTTGPTEASVSGRALGTYDVSVSAPGFRIEKKNWCSYPGQLHSFSRILIASGNVTETLTVVADAPAIQTETSEIGT